MYATDKANYLFLLKKALSVFEEIIAIIILYLQIFSSFQCSANDMNFIEELTYLCESERSVFLTYNSIINLCISLYFVLYIFFEIIER